MPLRCSRLRFSTLRLPIAAQLSVFFFHGFVHAHGYAGNESRTDLSIIFLCNELDYFTLQLMYSDQHRKHSSVTHLL
ncbi:hypothetical protein CPB84DRAFT_1779525 [Gymnopilus junonius]|uniref:Uncharacterized protein n=1 Tax=Gymnopilus junonius TaxID=109634 RepID=A0A9P5NQ63_GYMJU|nr:hypothetical protein CPB84DRAFT_1779525 [Gymnopilus junonius]